MGKGASSKGVNISVSARCWTWHSTNDMKCDTATWFWVRVRSLALPFLFFLIKKKKQQLPTTVANNSTCRQDIVHNLSVPRGANKIRVEVVINSNVSRCVVDCQLAARSRLCTCQRWVVQDTAPLYLNSTLLCHLVSSLQSMYTILWRRQVLHTDQ